MLRELYITKVKKDKELSVMERRLLETTLELFITEAALASGRSENDIEQQILSIFGG